MKYFLTILTIFTFQLSFAQMRVEDIKTEKDIRKFVSTYYKSKNHVRVRLHEKHQVLADSLQKAVCDSLGLSSVVKVEMNDDGEKDLVFCGFINESFRAVAFISNSKRSYDAVPIYYDLDDWTLNRCYVKQLSDSLLVLAAQNRYQRALNLDTIVYREGFFAEYTSRKRLYEIDSVKVSIVSMGGINIVVISPQGAISSYKFQRIDSSGKQWLDEYQIKIPSDSAISLLKYIARLPLYKYENMYPCWNVDDGFNWVTNVSFKGGCMLNIWDHMSIGPYGLKYLYDFVYKLFGRKDLLFVKKVGEDDIRALVSNYNCHYIKWLNWDL